MRPPTINPGTATKSNEANKHYAARKTPVTWAVPIKWFDHQIASEQARNLHWSVSPSIAINQKGAADQHLAGMLFDLAQCGVSRYGIECRCVGGPMAMRDYCANRLLAVFPDVTLALLKSHLSNVTLPQGAVCFNASDPIERVYFPTSGLISLVISTQGGDLVEAGMIGREGAAGLQNAVARRPSFTRAIVQIPGLFLAIPAEPLRHAIEKSERAKALVNRYTEILWAEAQQLAACNAAHQSLPRLSRWLLQSADRTGHKELSLTQEFLGEMLSSERTCVNRLEQKLEQRGIIKYGRGKIIILDRAALEATACECYQVIRNLYRDELATGAEEAGTVPRDIGDRRPARTPEAKPANVVAGMHNRSVLPRSSRF